jgi:hypothetical protein
VTNTVPKPAGAVVGAVVGIEVTVVIVVVGGVVGVVVGIVVVAVVVGVVVGIVVVAVVVGVVVGIVVVAVVVGVVVGIVVVTVVVGVVVGIVVVAVVVGVVVGIVVVAVVVGVVVGIVVVTVVVGVVVGVPIVIVPGTTVAEIELPPSAWNLFSVTCREVVPGASPLTCIVPTLTFVAPGVIWFPKSTPTNQTESAGNGPICENPGITGDHDGNIIPTISALVGSPRLAVILNPDKPSGNESTVMGKFAVWPGTGMDPLPAVTVVACAPAARVAQRTSTVTSIMFLMSDIRLTSLCVYFCLLRGLNPLHGECSIISGYSSSYLNTWHKLLFFRDMRVKPSIFLMNVHF